MIVRTPVRMSPSWIPYQRPRDSDHGSLQRIANPGILRPDFERSRYGHLSYDNPLLVDGKVYVNCVAFSEAIAGGISL